MGLPALRDLLNQHFNDAELRQLTFDLGTEYENLPGNTRILKVQSLVEHCLRHGRLPHLITHCRQLYPKVAWPDGAALTTEGQHEQPGQATPAPTVARGGIRAGTIQATNVVVGIQQAGGDHTTAPDPAVLAEALRHGRITADSIEAQNIVSGIQHIADPPEETSEK